MNVGNVVAVKEETIATELAADAAVGATVLDVEDAIDFVDDGGDLTITSDATGVSEELTYAAADDDAQTVTLDAPLAIAYTAGDILQPLPVRVERYAEVRFEDGEETLQALVPHALYEKLPVGIRDVSADEMEMVEVGRNSDGDLVVADVLARPANMTFSPSDPATGTITVDDANGLQVHEPDGTLSVHFPTDGGEPVFTGHVLAKFGVDIDAADVGELSSSHMIRWLRFDGTEVATMYATADLGAFAIEVKDEAGDEVAQLGLSDAGGAGISAGGTSISVDADGSANVAQLALPGTWREEYVVVSVNLPSTPANSGGSLNVPIPALAVGDLVELIAYPQANFHVVPQGPCTVAGQVTLNYWNLSSSTVDPGAQDYHFHVIHLS